MMNQGFDVEWNQISQSINTDNYRSVGNVSITQGLIALTNSTIYSNHCDIINGFALSTGHKYYSAFNIKTRNTEKRTFIYISFGTQNQTLIQIEFFSTGICSGINTFTNTNKVLSSVYIYSPYATPFSASDIIEVEGITTIDLTQMFGSGNEPSTTAEFEQWLIENGINPNEYIPYNAGEKRKMTKPSWI